jgi:hypothetical protein
MAMYASNWSASDRPSKSDFALIIVNMKHPSGQMSTGSEYFVPENGSWTWGEERADAGGQLARDLAAEPEIGNEDLMIRLDENALWFDVPVRIVVAVQSVQRPQDVPQSGVERSSSG